MMDPACSEMNPDVNFKNKNGTSTAKYEDNSSSILGKITRLTYYLESEEELDELTKTFENEGRKMQLYSNQLCDDQGGES